MRPGFHAVATHRVATWLRTVPRPLRVLLAPVVTVLYLWNRNVYGIELPAETVVGRRLRISHQGGIVIHGSARIGDDCVIRQNVTIGAVNPERASHAPTLGTGVEVGAGAAIIGRVTVGDGARIGPNSVIMSNVPAGSTAFAPNARVIQMSRRPTAVPEQQSTA
jgi:serine O-acetyltransferase